MIHGQGVGFGPRSMPLAVVDWEPQIVMDDTETAALPSRPRASSDLASSEPPTEGPDPVASAERYRVRGALGRGGGGEVHRVHDRWLRRDVALKTLGQGPPDPSTRRRFVQEAQVAGQLEHPNIVTVYDLRAEPGSDPFFTMRVLPGRSLAQRLADGSWLGLPARLRVMLEICDAIAYAHARGVIHRDLKPSNVMMGDFGEVVVVDWGVAKLLGEPEPGPITPHPVTSDADEEPVALTRADSLVGTPAYMAPEQAAGDSVRVGIASDVYALGAMLYELVTDARPFDPGPDLLGRVQRGQWVPLRRRTPRVSRELQAAIERAMAQRPEDRYATVLELRADIEAFLDRRPLSVVRYGVGARVRKLLARNAAVAGAVALTSVVALAVLAFGGLRYVRDVVAAHDRAVQAERVAQTRHADSQVALARALARQDRYDEAWAALHDARRTYRRLGQDDRRAVFVASLMYTRAPPPLVRDEDGLQISPDGRMLVKWGPQGFTVHDPATLEVLAAIERPTQSVSIGFSPDGVRFAERRGSHWTVFDADDRERLTVPAAADDEVAFVVGDGTALVTTRPLTRHPLDGSAAVSVARALLPWVISHDGRVVVGRDPGIDSEMVESRLLQIDLAQGHVGPSRPRLDGAAVSADGRWMIGHERDGGALVLLDLHEDAQVWRRPVERVARHQFVAGDRVRGVDEVGLVDRRIEDGAVLKSVRLPQPVVVDGGGGLTHAAGLLAVAETQGSTLWAVPDRDWRVPLPAGNRTAVPFPDGRLMIAAADDTLRVFDVWTGALVRILPGRRDDQRVAVAPGGRRLLVAGRHGAMRVVDLVEGTQRPLADDDPQHGTVTAIAWASADVVLRGRTEGPVERWSVARGQRLGVLGEATRAAWSIAVGSRWAVIGGRTEQGPVWAVARWSNGEIVAAAKERMVGYGVALSPDEQRLAATTHDGRVLMVELPSATTHTLVQRRGVALDVAWSGDGTLLAAAYLDGQVLVLDTQTWQEVLGFTLTDAVTRVEFVGPGHVLIVWDRHGWRRLDLGEASRPEAAAISLTTAAGRVHMANAAAARRGFGIAARWYAPATPQPSHALDWARVAWAARDHEQTARHLELALPGATSDLYRAVTRAGL